MSSKQTLIIFSLALAGVFVLDVLNPANVKEFTPVIMFILGHVVGENSCPPDKAGK